MATIVPNRPINIITASGAVVPNELNVFSAGSTLAVTLGAPGYDGQIISFTDISGHAHTVTTAANGINGNHATLTFGAAIGTSMEMFAYNGVWWTRSPATSAVVVS